MVVRVVAIRGDRFTGGRFFTHFIADFRKLVGRTPADYATAVKGNRSMASRATKAG